MSEDNRAVNDALRTLARGNTVEVPKPQQSRMSHLLRAAAGHEVDDADVPDTDQPAEQPDLNAAIRKAAGRS